MISQEEHDEQVRAARAWQAAHPPVVPVKTDAERIDALVKVTAKLIAERCFLLGENSWLRTPTTTRTPPSTRNTCWSVSVTRRVTGLRRAARDARRR